MNLLEVLDAAANPRAATERKAITINNDADVQNAIRTIAGERGLSMAETAKIILRSALASAGLVPEKPATDDVANDDTPADDAVTVTRGKRA